MRKALLLGEEQDTRVKEYIQALREEWGVITVPVIMVVGRAIEESHNRMLLSENGGHIVDISISVQKI